MPKLYEYFGIILFFYSNEHEPIHVHARQGEREARINFLVENGRVTHLEYQNVVGKKLLNKKQKQLVLGLAEVLADEIVQSWINYFVLHKQIVFKKIAGKL